MDIKTAHILDSLGWAVTHSLWQGALAALAIFIFRATTKDNQANLRCGFELLALGFCFAAFIVNFALNILAPISPAPVMPALVEIFNGATALPVDTAINGSAVPISGQSFTRYTPLLGVMWCFGFILLATRYTIGFAMTRRLRTKGLSPAPRHWQDKFRVLVLNSGIYSSVSLHISNRVTAPVTLGFLKPVVLVPASFFSGLPSEQIEAILMHEIAHIRRHDYLINLFQTAIKTVLFFHPAIHYICKTIDEDREKACDDFAVSYTQNPAALARGLATLRLNLTPPNFAMAATQQRKPLLRRLTRLTAPEETRRRPAQVATTLAALLVAAGTYTAMNVQFANAHPPETSDIMVKDPLHVSADKKNYRFDTISYKDRIIAIKIAKDETRWVYFNNSWFNIDKSPDILDKVPSKPKAPKMPRSEKYTSYVKFEKAIKQYRVGLDYYIASLNLLEQSEDVRSKLHWAKKQKNRVSDPRPDFDQDLLWKETKISPKKPAPKPVAIPVPTPKPAPQTKAKLAPTAKPAQPVRPAPIDITTTFAEVDFDIRDGERQERWEEKTEELVERIAEKFEEKMDRIEDDFEDAVDAFEDATEDFVEDPEAHRADFNQAQRDFAKAALDANSKRAVLTKTFDHEIQKTVNRQVQNLSINIQDHVVHETEKALEKAFMANEHSRLKSEAARMDSERARIKSEKARMKSEQTRIQSDKIRIKTNQQRQKHAEFHLPTPSYDDYGQVMLAKLGNDGVIPHGSSSVNIEYKDGDMYVNGRAVSQDVADGYCSINKAFNIKKSDNMRIEVKPERLTISDYNY